MGFTAKQYKAIKWYAEKEELRPQLSAYPTVYFLNKDGVTVKENILSLTTAYEGREKREKRKTRKALN